MVENAERQQLIEKVRAACIEAALRGYEEASMAGLCAEGALECAVDAIRTADLSGLLQHPAPGA